MTLSDLALRLGRRELARRAGVTPATLGRWISKGPSKAGAEILSAVLRRHEGSIKSAATRRRHAQEATGIEVPKQAELTASQILPIRTPSDREAKAALRAEDLGAASKQPIDSIYNVGHIEWIMIDKPVLEVTTSEIIDHAVAARQSSGRQLIQIKFLFFRYIPFNPFYRGELAKKQGNWVEWWAQTNTQYSINSLTRNVEYVLDLGNRAAATRVIHLQLIGVAIFDRRPSIEITRPLSSR